MEETSAPYPRTAIAPAGGPEIDRDARELLERAMRGDRRAWARLYPTLFDRIFRDVAYLVGACPVAEEIVQETFAIALKSLDRFDQRASVVGWLGGIARNLARRHWRSSSRRSRAYDRLEQTPLAPTTAEDPEHVHLRERRADVLSDVLTTLPDHLREAFVLCDVQGLSAADASECLGTTVGNVRVRASRARALIRGELQRRGWIGAEAP